MVISQQEPEFVIGSLGSAVSEVIIKAEENEGSGGGRRGGDKVIKNIPKESSHLYSRPGACTVANLTLNQSMKALSLYPAYKMPRPYF